MKCLSFRDILLALPQFKNEIELLHPDNDKVVHEVLEAVGFDTRQPIEYEANFHRDMQNNTGVGFIARGEYNMDPKYSKFMDMTDRTVIVGLTDVSFAKEISILAGKKFNYRNEDEGDFKSGRKPNDPRYYSHQELLDMGFTSGDEEDEPYDDVDTSFEVLDSQITTMNNIKITLRGN